MNDALPTPSRIETALPWQVLLAAAYRRLDHKPYQWQAYRYAKIYMLHARGRLRQHISAGRMSQTLRIPKWRCVSCNSGNPATWPECIKCGIPRAINHELISLGMLLSMEGMEDVPPGEIFEPREVTPADAWAAFMERREMVIDALAREKDLAIRERIKQVNHAYLYTDIRPPASLRKKIALRTKHPLTIP